QRRSQADAANTARGESRGEASGLVSRMTADAGVARQVTGDATGQVTQSRTHEQQLQADLAAARQDRQQKWAAMMSWATNHRALREQVSDERPSEEVAPVGDFPEPAPGAPQMA
ncbi:MAG: hypothetical protein NT062_11440, partial [Proteobacteria bacterium]|nr:hypothetical protein [Pseudomonadota bacterium]